MANLDSFLKSGSSVGSTPCTTLYVQGGTTYTVPSGKVGFISGSNGGTTVKIISNITTSNLTFNNVCPIPFAEGTTFEAYQFSTGWDSLIVALYDV